MLPGLPTGLAAGWLPPCFYGHGVSSCGGARLCAAAEPIGAREAVNNQPRSIPATSRAGSPAPPRPPRSSPGRPGDRGAHPTAAAASLGDFRRAQPRSSGPKRVPQTRKVAGNWDRVCPSSHIAASQRGLAAGSVNPLATKLKSCPRREGGEGEALTSSHPAPQAGERLRPRRHAGERHEPIQSCWEGREGLHAPGKGCPNSPSLAAVR